MSESPSMRMTWASVGEIVQAIERLVPVPPMSDAAFGVLSRIRYSGNAARGLWDAVRVGKIPPDDLPPIIAALWTRNDAPTTDLGDEDWVEMFRAAASFVSTASRSG